MDGRSPILFIKHMNREKLDRLCCFSSGLPSLATFTNRDGEGRRRSGKPATSWLSGRVWLAFHHGVAVGRSVGSADLFSLSLALEKGVRNFYW